MRITFQSNDVLNKNIDIWDNKRAFKGKKNISRGKFSIKDFPHLFNAAKLFLFVCLFNS